jgi:hypothetical protein
MAESVAVCVRIRPVAETPLAWAWTDRQICNNPELDPFGYNASSYSFDHLFPPESTNEEIFSSACCNIANAAMEGYHGSIFSYGQTSSGKTFTMTGGGGQQGIIQQSICFIFNHIQSETREFLLRVSYLEVG